MSFASWQEPVRLLETLCSLATKEQRRLAETIGLSIAADTPRRVAAVLLEDHLQPVIWGLEPESASDKQRAFLDRLGERVAAGDADLSKSAASAWIDHLLSLQTIQTLKKLRPSTGDEVIQHHVLRNPGSDETREYEAAHVVSSIGANGLVYFKGGNGRCGWPSTLYRATSDADQQSKWPTEPAP